MVAGGVGAIVAAGVALPSAASADGGPNIASAAPLRIGTTVTGGAANVTTFRSDFWQHPDEPGVQFWRIDLGRADQLTIDYANVVGAATGVCVLPPSTTDFTAPDSQCSAQDRTEAKHQLKFTAPTPGSWIVAVGDTRCCEFGWAYELTAYVRRYTRTALRGPSAVRAGRLITLRGQVTGATSGTVAIQRSVKGRWRTVSRAALRPDGSFSSRQRISTRGRHRFRASFAGNSGHLASSATHSLRVR